jgi:hypothetical protein
MIVEPKFRCTSAKSIAKLAQILNVPNNSQMQDWEWEIADHKRLNEYIHLYGRRHMTDDDRIALMETIIQSVDDLYSKNGFLPRQWNRVKNLIIQNSEIHRYTVFYWSNLSEFLPCYYSWSISKQMSSLYLCLYQK